MTNDIGPGPISSRGRSDQWRADVALRVRWGGYGLEPTEVRDLSMGGCFVLSPRRVALGEVVGFEVSVAEGEWVTLRGRVVRLCAGTGFGVCFVDLTERARIKVARLIAEWRAGATSSAGRPSVGSGPDELIGRSLHRPSSSTGNQAM